jgi:hypothetical protein
VIQFKKYVIAFVILVACKQTDNNEIYYYPTGEVNEEYEIENGKRHGIARSFYLSGKLKATGFYKNGLPDSTYTHYYENGNVKVTGEFDKQGMEAGEKKFYFETGELEQIEYLNDLGKVIDYVRFNKDGTRDLRLGLIIFETESDTIKFGDYYEAKIRFANRKYNYNEVILGDPMDKTLLGKLRLPKQDSITSLIKIKPEKPGENVIEGVLLDIDFTVNGKDTTILDYTIIRLKKLIWVLPPKSPPSSTSLG